MANPDPGSGRAMRPHLWTRARVVLGLIAACLAAPAIAQAPAERSNPPALDRPVGPDAPPPPHTPPPPTFTSTLVDPPLGFTGPSGVRPSVAPNIDFVPVEDRWRIGFPEWDRYGRGHPLLDQYPYILGRWFDPYAQNVLKGDYPIIGQHTFLNLTVSALSLFERGNCRPPPPRSRAPAGRSGRSSSAPPTSSSRTTS